MPKGMLIQSRVCPASNVPTKDFVSIAFARRDLPSRYYGTGRTNQIDWKR